MKALIGGVISFFLETLDGVDEQKTVARFLRYMRERLKTDYETLQLTSINKWI